MEKPKTYGEPIWLCQCCERPATHAIVVARLCDECYEENRDIVPKITFRQQHDGGIDE